MGLEVRSTAWISKAALRERAKLFSKNDYGRFLSRLVDV
jgi:hypothetical protein